MIGLTLLAACAKLLVALAFMQVAWWVLGDFVRQVRDLLLLQPTKLAMA